MKLYDYILSPSCYKVRLLAALTDTQLQLQPVDFHPGQEHKSDTLLALNPAGTLPIFQDGDLVLSQSSAILAYIASKCAPNWMGDGSAETAARTQQWLAFSERLTTNLGGARAVEMLHGSGDLDLLQKEGIAALRELEAALIEQKLRGQDYLAATTPTIADIACFPFVALAPDGSISLDPYPAIRLWMRSIRALPGFVEMPGIHRLHELTPDPFKESV